VRFIAIISCLMLLPWLFPAQAAAAPKLAWPAGGIKVSGFSLDATSHNAQAVGDGEGNFVVLWHCSWGSRRSLVAQKLNKAGQLLWGAEGVEVIETTAEVKTAKLVNLGSGEVGIVWDCWSTEEKVMTFAQKLDRAGQKLWHPDGVFVIAAGGSYFSPDAVPDGSGGILVALTAYEDPRFRNDILAQRIGGIGKRMWGNSGVLVSANIADQVVPRLITNGEGGVVVAWVDYRNGINNADIYAQKIDREGNTVWELNGVEVCRAADTQQNLQLVPDNANGAIIVWEDNGTGNYDIFAQRLNAAGVAQWKEDGVLVCGTFGDQKGPQIFSDGMGGVLAVWQDYRLKGWNIIAQHLDGLGRRLWEEDGIPVCFELGTQSSPRLIGSGQDSYLVAWEDYRSQKNFAVYAQSIDGMGQTGWDQNGILVSGKNGSARQPALARDSGDKSCLVVWDAFLPEGRGICAQKIVNAAPGKVKN